MVEVGKRCSIGKESAEQQKLSWNGEDDVESNQLSKWGGSDGGGMVCFGIGIGTVVHCTYTETCTKDP